MINEPMTADDDAIFCIDDGKNNWPVRPPDKEKPAIIALLRKQRELKDELKALNASYNRFDWGFMDKKSMKDEIGNRIDEINYELLQVEFKLHHYKMNETLEGYEE